MGCWQTAQLGLSDIGDPSVVMVGRGESNPSSGVDVRLAIPQPCRSASGCSVVRRHRPFCACMGAAWSVVVRLAGPYVRCRMPTVSLLRLPELAVSWCPRGRSRATSTAAPRSPAAAVAVAVSAGSYEGPQIKGVAPDRGVRPGRAAINPDREGSGRGVSGDTSPVVCHTTASRRRLPATTRRISPRS